MKRFVPILVIFLIVASLLMVCLNSEPNISEGTERTCLATVTDRAMSDNMPYLGVVLADGTELCLWDIRQNIIPDGVEIGDTITVTFAKQDGFDRFILLNVEP